MTEVDRKCFTFNWMVENASFCWHKKGETLESPSFIIHALHETEWCVFMYPKGYQNRSFLIYLKRKDNGKGPKEILLDFELSVIGKEGSPAKDFKRITRPFYKGSSYGGGDVPTWKEIFLSSKSSFLPNDTLTICCRMWKIGEEFPKSLQFSARTSIASEHKSFFIRIKDFGKLGSRENRETFIKSTVTQNMPLKFFLTDGLHGEENMIIEIVPANEKVRFVTFKMCVINSAGQKMKCNREECGFFYKKNKVWLFPLIFTKETLMAEKGVYLKNDTLTLQCECSFSNGEFCESLGEVDSNILFFTGKLASVDSNTSAAGVLEALKTLYTDQILCDVYLRTKKETFPAHRNILSARSPVFRSMFTSDMKERTNQFVDITDVDADVMRDMLQYVYTDSLEGFHFDTAYELYTVASKYQILDLKNKCSNFLRDELATFTVCDVLVLADMHQDKELKKEVQSFILKEGRKIFNSTEWKDFIKENIQLAAEIMLLKCIEE